MKRQIPFLVALALIISVVMTTVMMYGCNKKEAAETVTETDGLFLAVPGFRG